MISECAHVVMATLEISRNVQQAAHSTEQVSRFVVDIRLDRERAARSLPCPCLGKRPSQFHL